MFCLPSLTSFSGRTPATPAEATRAGCYRRTRLLEVIKVIKMMLILAIVAVSALPQATTEAALVSVKSDNSSSGLHAMLNRGRRGLKNLAVNEEGQPCLPNPLWERKVDPANYEYGCNEIEVNCLTSIP